MKIVDKIFGNIFVGILLLVAVTAFIFSHSVVSADVSSGESGKVVDIVKDVMESVNVEVDENVIVKTVRKTAHFSEFFALGAVCYYLRFIISKHPTKGFSLGALYGFLIALVDESLQYNSIGRSPEVLDVWIDVLGFSFSYFAFMLVFALISKRLISSRAARQES